MLKINRKNETFTVLKRAEVELEPHPDQNDVQPDELSLVAKEKTLGTSSGRLTLLQLKKLCKDAFGADWDAKRACVKSRTAPTS